MKQIEYRENFTPKLKELLNLYESVRWGNYTSAPVQLELAIRNSTYVACAYIDDELVGLARSMSDEISIHYLQDVLVDPKYQGRGIGKKLVNLALKRFEEVRTHILLTDDNEKQFAFYKTLGYFNTKNVSRFPLNAFVQMKGIDLE